MVGATHVVVLIIKKKPVEYFNNSYPEWHYLRNIFWDFVHP